MTKSDKVRRLMAKAKINGIDEDKLIKQVMKSCEFTRGLAVTYIRKNKDSAALRDTIKAMREKMAGTDSKPADKPASKRPGRPRKSTTVETPVVETPSWPETVAEVAEAAA